MVFPSNTQKNQNKQINKQDKNQPTKKNPKTKTHPPQKLLPHILSAGKDGWNWVLEKNLIDRRYANLHLLRKIMGTHIYNKNVISSS